MRRSITRMVFHVAALLACSTAMLKCSPTNTDEVAGFGSETTNGTISATLYYQDGAPAAGVGIRLRRISYLAGPQLTSGVITAKDTARTTTDEAGFFLLDSISAGEYFIEAVADKQTALRMSCTIAVNESDTLTLPPDTLKRTAMLGGVVQFDTTIGPEVVVQIYGLERYILLDKQTGTFEFNDLPPGTYVVRIAPLSASYQPQETTVRLLEPGTRLQLDTVRFVSFENESLAQWAFMRRLLLTTTVAGANVADTILDFPLLVRLDSTNFDFAQAQPGGRDIRFSKFDGTRLRYEVEQWDAANRSAALWVRVDTVKGADSTQLLMYWGNAQATDFSSATAVFDTGSGFAGVWHMTQSSDGTYRDATAHRYHGIDLVSTLDKAGYMGLGQRFNGISDHIDCGPSLRHDSVLTISAWVRLAKPESSGYHRLVSKKTAYNDSLGFEMVCNPYHSPNPKTALPNLMLNACGASINRGYFDWDARWHLCTVQANGRATVVMFDGIDVDKLLSPSVKSILAAPLTNLIIGGKAHREYFDGWLDEVRIELTARSPGWIKLCYENQRDDQRLISWK